MSAGGERHRQHQPTGGRRREGGQVGRQERLSCPEVTTGPSGRFDRQAAPTAPASRGAAPRGWTGRKAGAALLPRGHDRPVRPVRPPVIGPQGPRARRSHSYSAPHRRGDQRRERGGGRCGPAPTPPIAPTRSTATPPPSANTVVVVTRTPVEGISTARGSEGGCQPTAVERAVAHSQARWVTAALGMRPTMTCWRVPRLWPKSSSTSWWVTGGRSPSTPAS